MRVLGNVSDSVSGECGAQSNHRRRKRNDIANGYAGRGMVRQRVGGAVYGNTDFAKSVSGIQRGHGDEQSGDGDWSVNTDG